MKRRLRDPFDYLPGGSTTPLFPRARPASSRWLRASWAAWVGLGLGLGLGRGWGWG